MVTIGVVSTVRAPLSQLQLFVNYHLNIGVDHIILFFDDPQDEAFEAFSNYKQVRSIKCSSAYWQQSTKGDRPDSIGYRQIINANTGAKYLTEKGCNWISHIDSDELIHPLQDLKQILANSKVDGLRFSILEAVSENDHYEHIFLPQLFKKNARKNQIQLARKLGCKNAIFSNEYFRGHTLSKIIIRTECNIKQYRIHGVKSDTPLKINDSQLIQLLHFDCVDIDSWKKKWDWRIDGSGFAPKLGKHRKKQQSLYKKNKELGDEQLRSLFRKLHGIRKREQFILRLLGMLQTVKLDQRLFECKP